ncbi:MAG: hypothetical protein Fues2KO_25090 [Fuerstiella sp.]
MIAASAVLGFADETAADPQSDSPLSSDHPAKADVERAVAEFRKGQVQQALNRLIATSDEHPDLAPGEVMFAQLALAAGRAEQAQAALQQAVVRHPQDPEAWNLLGRLAMSTGRLAEADLLFAKAQEVVSVYSANEDRRQQQQVQATVGRATVCERRGQWDAAADHLRRWIELQPQNPAARLRLAQALFRQQEFQDAEQLLKEAHTLDDSQLPAIVLMGQMYEQAGLLKEAADAMQQASVMYPQELAVQLAVARWALTGARQEILEQALERAAAIDADSDVLRALTAMAHRFQGRSKEAEEIFRTLLQESPASFDASNGLALSLLEQDDTEKHQQALQYAQVNARSYQDLKSPRGRASAATYAWALHRVGQTPQATSMIQKVLTAGNVSPEVGYIAADILAAADRVDDAIKLLEASLASPAAFPQQDEARRLLARLKS